MSNVYPRNFSHIGISVPSLKEAVKFYTEVMGWYLIMEPTKIVEDDSAIGEMCTEVFGKVSSISACRIRTLKSLPIASSQPVAKSGWRSRVTTTRVRSLIG